MCHRIKYPKFLEEQYTIALVSGYLAHIVVLQEHLQTHYGCLFLAQTLLLVVESKTVKTSNCFGLKP